MATNARWLSANEQELWRALLAAVRKIYRGLDETLQAGGSLSLSEFSVLVTLSEAEGHTLRLREICAELDWDRSRTSHQITRMGKRGLVTKCRSAGDGRGVEISATEEGLERLRAAAPEHVEAVRRLIFDHLDSQDTPVLQNFFNNIIEAARRNSFERETVSSSC